MTDKAAFLELSSELTGFDSFDLAATGLADEYFKKVDGYIGPETLRRLFDAWRAIERDFPAGKRTEAVADRIIAVEPLREAAQRIIMLWYVGSWYLVTPGGSSVVSAESYVEGLMWKAIRSHPMAAKPQGYGAWALSPPDAA